MPRLTQYAVVIALKDGGCFSTTAVGNMRSAIDEAFACAQQEGLEGDRVVFCKSEHQLTDEELEMWDMPIPVDVMMEAPAPARVWAYDLY